MRVLERLRPQCMIQMLERGCGNILRRRQRLRRGQHNECSYIPIGVSPFHRISYYYLAFTFVVAYIYIVPRTHTCCITWPPSSNYVLKYKSESRMRCTFQKWMCLEKPDGVMVWIEI